MKEIKLSTHQLHMMQHAIGYNPFKVRKGQFVAHRNYFSASINDEWGELVSSGLATIRQSPFNDTEVVYHLTQKGIDTLSSILGISIMQKQ